MPVRLTKEIVAKSIAAGVKNDVKDAGAKGLILRVWGQGKWSWNLRRTVNGRDYRIDLGTEWTLDEARDLAHEADRIIRSGDLPFNVNGTTPLWLQRRAAEHRGETEPQRVFVPRTPPAPPSISYEDAVAIWVEGLNKTHRASTVTAYKSAVRIRELHKFFHRQVRDITIEDLAEAVAEIHGRAERQAATSAIALRGLFSFLGRNDKRKRTAVLEGCMDRLTAPRDTLVEEGDEEGSTHIPGRAELGSILRTLEDPALDITERDRLACLLLLYTCQRRRAVALARVADFVQIDGRLCWRIPPIHRKTASIRRRKHGASAVGDHVLPLSPQAEDVFRRALAQHGEDKQQCLFPPTRNRRADKPSTSTAPERITHLFRELGFAASPHDVRRGFATTYGAFAGLSDSDTKLVLDHSEGIPSGDVTALHYRFLLELRRKDEALTGWANWLQAQASGDGGDLHDEDAAALARLQ